MLQSRKVHVFLCHATQDKAKVREIYYRLKAEGWIDPWLDEEKLLPGQDWDLEISNAVKQTDVVIVCLSNDSLNKKGYVQKEIRMALDTADKMLEGQVYIIPLRLEECIVPSRLSKWQWLNYFGDELSAYKILLSALKSKIVIDSLDVEDGTKVVAIETELSSMKMEF